MIRMARPEDGPAIGDLFRAAGQDLGLDWTAPDIAHWWLVAERDGAVVGAVQILASQPTGYIGDMVIARSATAPQTPLARALWARAELLLRGAGCQRVAATLRGRPGWRRLVTRYTGMDEHTEPVVLVSKEL